MTWSASWGYMAFLFGRYLNLPSFRSKQVVTTFLITSRYPLLPLDVSEKVSRQSALWCIRAEMSTYPCFVSKKLQALSFLPEISTLWYMYYKISLFLHYFSHLTSCIIIPSAWADPGFEKSSGGQVSLYHRLY